MTIGTGIFLIVVGLIVRYAINVNISGVEEGTLGAILIAAGAVVAVLGLIAAPFRLWAARRSGYGPPDDRAGYYR